MQDFSKLFKNQGFQDHPQTPKIRNLGRGFVLLTVGPFQETVEFHEIHEVTQILQDRLLNT